MYNKYGKIEELRYSKVHKVGKVKKIYNLPSPFSSKIWTVSPMIRGSIWLLYSSKLFNFEFSLLSSFSYPNTSFFELCCRLEEFFLWTLVWVSPLSSLFKFWLVSVCILYLDEPDLLLVVWLFGEIFLLKEDGANIEEIISFSLFFRFPLFMYDRFDKEKVATDDEADPKKLQITEK